MSLGNSSSIPPRWRSGFVSFASQCQSYAPRDTSGKQMKVSNDNENLAFSKQRPVILKQQTTSRETARLFATVFLG